MDNSVLMVDSDHRSRACVDPATSEISRFSEDTFGGVVHLVAESKRQHLRVGNVKNEATRHNVIGG
jgi:hypothetical protein